MNRFAELVSTGSELLNGRTLNRHAQVLGSRLAEIGFRLTRDTTVPDDLEAIREATESALGRVDVVVVSGGLGPTSDDVTRDAIADLIGGRVVMHESTRDHLRERYLRLGRSLTPAGERQALIIEGAEVLPNRVGAAPGQCIAFQSKTLFLLPGPPGEFKAVLEDGVVPCLLRVFGHAELPPSLTFMVSGIGESDLVTRLESAGLLAPGLEISYSAAPARVELAFRQKNGGELPPGLASSVRRTLGSLIFAEERKELQEVVAEKLVARGATLAVAESCTGGLLGDRLTTVSGSSAFFLGGVIAYSNAGKVRELGVDETALGREGAVSEAVAGQMAEGARRRFDADFGVGVTGIAGPTGGSRDKPVGLVYIAVADRQRVRARRHRFPGDRAGIKEWSVQTALNLLRLRLEDALE